MSKPFAESPREDRPLRVCFVIDWLARAGTELQLLALLKHLDRNRVEPYLCLLRSAHPESREIEPTDCRVYRMNVPYLRHPSTVLAAAHFARYLRREGVDVVQTYHRDSSYFATTAARLARVRTVRTRFNQGWWMNPLDRWIGRFHSRLVDASIVNSEASRGSLIADEWADPDSIHVIENGVELEQFAALPDPVLTNDGPRPRRVGLVANLRPVKEPELFVKAAGLLASKHPEVEFHVAGEGRLREGLERQIAELGLSERIILRGQIRDIAEFLAGVDYGVLCSRTEGLPNAVLEYMAAGRAIVATKVGGIPEVIEDNVHGLLVPPGDAGQLAAALDRLLCDPDLAARVGAAARERAQARFDPRRRARTYEEFYERLVEGD